MCNRHRWRTFFAWLLALVAIQVLASAVGVKEISSFRLPGTESQRAYDLLAQHFPAAKGDTDQVVFRARSGRLDQGADRRRIEAALKQVAADRHVAGVGSPFSQGGRLTRDGRIGVATITYKESTNDIEPDDLTKLERAAFTARSPQLQVEHGGPGAEIVRYNSTQGPSEGVGILAAAVVLLITFGSAVAAGLPLLATMLALGSALGVITLISHLVDTPDFATQLASLIGIGVGIDYALFVVTRFRAEVRAGRSRDEAIETAIDTAGRTVMFAAITVVIALLGLLLLGLSFMHGVAIGAAVAVLTTMFAALTIIPSLIGGSGNFIDGVFRELDARGGLRLWGMQRRIPVPGRGLRAARSRRRERRQSDGAGWERWSRAVQRRPWVAGGLALVLLIGLALPVTNLRLGSSDAGVDPPGSTTRKAYDLIAQGFGAGTNGSFLLVAELARKGDQAAARQIAAAVKQDPDVTFVAPPAVSPDGKVATITAYPRTGPQDAATTDALNRLRDDVLPPVAQRTGARVEVGGFTASNEDFSNVVAGKLPLFVGVVVLFSALLLLAVFRSVIIPIKAAVMNLLSIGAALGFVTLIFQEGHGAGLLGIGTGPIESFVPVLMFAIVFGLSMDYEVFLISRVHEEWERTRDASASVARGLQTTGRVITAAASIMVVVFASFALGDDRIIKLFGIGLASAVFFDAVVIRCLLVPALMELFGRHAWWVPSWLDRRLPRLAIEAPAEPEAAPPVERVPEPV
ncbi:MAG TPA: MMPL family transporter [Baekduia sp.]|nr:MMPL family transporter [Baekduia sp.]